MNHFERVAIFTLVENIENQLKGLKTLISASANTGAPQQTHKTTALLDPESHELSEEEEERLQAELAANIERMRKSAESAFQGEWETVSKKLSDLDQ